MARSEARISTDIWDNDSDFTALSSDAQWMYWFLLAQRDLAHDGVIALRPRRWSTKAAGLKPEQVESRIAELEDARYVVVDRDAEELLIRSFIRRDKVYRQPNVLRAALDHLPMVSSLTLRRAILRELLRIRQMEMPDGSAPIVEEMIGFLTPAAEEPSGETQDGPSTEAPPDPSGNPSAEPSPETTAGTPGDRGTTTTVSKYSPSPVPRSPEDSANADAPPDATLESEALFGAPAPEPADKGTPSTHPKKTWTSAEIDSDPKFMEFWAAYPSIKGKGRARPAWIKALRSGIDPDVLTKGALAYRNDPKRKPDYTMHAATWLNGEHWGDYETPVAAPATYPTQRPWWEN